MMIVMHKKNFTELQDDLNESGQNLDLTINSEVISTSQITGVITATQ